MAVQFHNAASEAKSPLLNILPFSRHRQSSILNSHSSIPNSQFSIPNSQFLSCGIQVFLKLAERLTQLVYPAERGRDFLEVAMFADRRYFEHIGEGELSCAVLGVLVQ